MLTENSAYYANAIADISLNKGSIKIDTTKKLPLYVYNNALLEKFDERQLIRDSIINIIQENNLEFDIIIGTKPLGVAHAASLSFRLKVPLFIVDDHYEYEYINCLPDHINDKRGKDSRSAYTFTLHKDYDLIVATYPYAIPLGIGFADTSEISFCYAREIESANEKKIRIEGITKKGQNGRLFDKYTENSNIERALNELSSKGVIIKDNYSSETMYQQSIKSINGKKALVIDDILLTGKNTAQEIDICRDRGAIVEDVITIFDYGFEDTKGIFGATSEYKKNRALYERVNVYSSLNYNILIEIMKNKKIINDDDILILDKWKSDRFIWENTH